MSEYALRITHDANIYEIVMGEEFSTVAMIERYPDKLWRLTTAVPPRSNIWNIRFLNHIDAFNFFTTNQSAKDEVIEAAQHDKEKLEHLRNQAAVAAMQGWLASHTLIELADPKRVTEFAIECADELMKGLGLVD